MLAKNVNDNARCLNKRGACEFFASKLAPTTIQCVSRLACDSGLTADQDVAHEISLQAVGSIPSRSSPSLSKLSFFRILLCEVYA